MYHYTCKHCKKVFKASGKNRKYCSRKCSSKEGSVKGGHAGGAILRKRAHDAYYANPNICKQCDSIIPIPPDTQPCITRAKKFCDHSCAAKYNNLHSKAPRKKAKTRTCGHCSAEYRVAWRGRYKSTILCAPCSKKYIETAQLSYRETTIGEYRNKISVKGKHPSWLAAHVRGFCRSWNKDLSKVCEICGYAKHIEFCHIRDISDFPDSATMGEVNSPKNVRILCRNHHWEFDNGLLE